MNLIARQCCAFMCALLLTVAAFASKAHASQEQDPPEASHEEELEQTDSSRTPFVFRHRILAGFGVHVPLGLAGIKRRGSEAVFRIGAGTAGDSNAQGAGYLEYRRRLLAVRLTLAGKSLGLAGERNVEVWDGAQTQTVRLLSQGGYFAVAALAGIQWEPVLYTATGGGEGLALALTALGGQEYVSLWGRFGPERIPNYRIPEKSFHWIIARQRLQADVALRWRHMVASGRLPHLLGLELGLTGAVLVHIPGLSTASSAISGVKGLWGEWGAVLRLTWEMGLPEG